MNRNDPTGHLAPQRLQALLEGELSPRERTRAEEHLTSCARCAADFDSWGLLFADLGGLGALSPEPGFSDRVMAEVHPVGPAVAAVREHLEAAILQEYLDGALEPRAAALVDAHLAACDACTEEIDSWALIHSRLEGLGRHTPRTGFSQGIMAGVVLPGAPSFAARVRDCVRALVKPAAAHVHAGRLQDYVDGLLPARQAARVRTHLDACAACSSEVGVWEGLVERLGSLRRFAPEPTFAARVVAGVRVGPVPARTRQGAPAWSRALATVRRFAPRTRRAWAAISGMAVTPAVTAALVLYTVFSHPTVTLGTLASFVGWQVADLSSAAWGAASGAALQSAELFGIYSLIEAMASAPVAVACGAVLYSLGSVVALRVLYRNVVASRPLEGRYVGITAS